MNRTPWPATLAVLLLIGCDTREKIALAELANGCYLNSDCADGLVCAFQRCHHPCTKDTDCTPIADQLLCVQSDRPFKVCLLPQESTCVYNTDCQAGQVCAVDLRCHPECLTERDCAPEQVCASGNCAKPSQVSDAGALIPAADGGVPGMVCNYSSDCPGTFVCRSGVCMAECKSQRDCPLGADCEKGSCAAGKLSTDGGSGSGTACLLPSDCPPGQVCGLDARCRYECLEARDCNAGACCYQRSCRRGAICGALLPDGGLFDAGVVDAGYCLNDLACNDQNFCNGIELCVNNRCQKAAHPICDDFNPCTIDMCNAATGTCAYATSALDAGDDDHDGHRAVQCGGGADDCDDTNPAVFEGNPEVCDFLDNNCNGEVDEGQWSELLPSRISLHGAAIYPDWTGRPGVVRVDGGFLAVVASDTFAGQLEAYRLDQSLALVQGPVPLFGSVTQWSTPPGAPTVFGKRILRPRVAVNPAGEVLTTAWVGDAPGVTTCPAASKWTLHTPVYRSDALLGGLRSWGDVDSENTSATCPSTLAPELYYPRVMSADVTWSPGASRWIALWGSNPVTTLQGDLVGGTFDVDGGIGNRHNLLQPPDSNLYQTPYYAGAPAPWMVAGPSNVLVAFDSPVANEPRYVLMDPSLGSRVSIVRDIYQPGARVAAVGLAPQGYFIATRLNAATSLRFFSTATGLQVGGTWTLPPLSGPPGNPSHGTDSTNELAIAPFQDGFVSIENDWPDATFSFISSKTDGGTVSAGLKLPATPRSGFTIVPIDDRTVGVLWTDGEFKRTLMRCGP